MKNINECKNIMWDYIKMKRRTVMLLLLLPVMSVISGCTDKTFESLESKNASVQDETLIENSTEIMQEAESVIHSENVAISEAEKEESRKMQVQIGNTTFTATLENNDAADRLKEMIQEQPITISMSDYSGFEKVGSLGTSLPTSNEQTTTQAGDIVLYNGNKIVIFYGSNSWSYTRLGKIDDLSGWKDALGRGDVTVTFSID